MPLYSNLSQNKSFRLVLNSAFLMILKFSALDYSGNFGFKGALKLKCRIKKKFRLQRHFKTAFNIELEKTWEVLNKSLKFLNKSRVFGFNSRPYLHEITVHFI